MEYNKGNATAGQLASQGLITDLTDVATERGWDTTTSPASIQTTAKYDEHGVMGSGDWYGVPNYGEFVGVYYNKDAFDQLGIAVPTTLDEFDGLAGGVQGRRHHAAGHGRRRVPDGSALVRARRCTRPTASSSTTTSCTRTTSTSRATSSRRPPTSSTSGSRGLHRLGLRLARRPRTWVSPSSTAPTRSWSPARGGSAASSRRSPASTGASSSSRAPTCTLGSSGNLWVVPENAKAKDLAYDFIDITMRPEIQDDARQQRRPSGRGDSVDDHRREERGADRELQRTSSATTAWRSTPTGRCPASTT